MNRLLLVAALLLVGSSGCRQETVGPDRIARVLSGLRPARAIKGEPEVRWSLAERMAHYRVPGVSIAVIDSGRIVWARGFGVKTAGTNDSINAETVFQAGSISKPTFALGAMRLVQDGKLALDEDVNLKLKSWKVPENRFTVDEKVTLRRILSHTAGLTVHGFPGYQAGAPLPTVPQILDGLEPANTAPVRVDTLPGSISRYSGGGTTVGMLVVTDVTGEPFLELMDRLVLRPAGMTRSSYRQPIRAEIAPNAASGHTSDGTVVPGKYHIYPEMSAAGLWTTPSDLARLAIALEETLAGKSAKIVARATFEQMLAPQPPVGEEAFGLGYHVTGSGANLEFEHGGADVGFRADFIAFGQRGQGAVVMTNGDAGDGLIEELMASIAAEYGWPSHHPVERTVVALDSVTKADLVGSYRLEVTGFGTGTALVTSAGSRLTLDVNIGGLGKDEMLAESDSTFFLRESGIPVAFERDRNNRVVAIVISGSVRGKKAPAR